MVNNGITKFAIEAKDFSEQNSEFHYSETENGLPILIGKLVLDDQQGVPYDFYNIKIEPSSNYPFAFPYVYETGGRIPVNIDWHVWENDGHCCIRSAPEEVLLCKKGIDLNWFVETQVKPYFHNQKYRELHGFFLHERAHGLEGNNEFFKEIFRSPDLRLIAKGLLFIKLRREPNRVAKCFCGSGEKFRKCHREAYRQLSNFTDKELEDYAHLILLETL